MPCPSDNSQDIDQSSFWSQGTLHWDAHRAGWAIAGACALVVRAVSLTKIHFPHTIADGHYLCHIRSSTLSVRHGLTSDTRHAQIS